MNRIITLSREFGTGAAKMAQEAAKETGYAYYDKEILEAIARELGVDERFFSETGYAKATFGALSCLTLDNAFYDSARKVISSIKGPAIIVGRCSDYVLRKRENVISVFVYAEQSYRLIQLEKQFGWDAHTALKQLRRVDSQRARFYEWYTDRLWKDIHSYDMMLNAESKEFKTILKSLMIK